MPSPRFFDPRRGDPPLYVESLAIEEIYEPERTNCFSIYSVTAGRGAMWADAARHEFGAGSLLFFVPYQHVRLEPDEPIAADLVTFHANFLCVETFHAEVGCSGILFNDPYGTPVVTLDRRTKKDVAGLIDRIRREQAEPALAGDEVALASLKILLVLASRLKSPSGAITAAADPRHPILNSLKELIEQHYRTCHAPSDYAERLHLTPKTLGRIVREHFGITLTDLIRQRILTHAKWQLLHSLRPVKEIAAELGFRDELYFSRLFKKATGVSPTYFREFETEIRGGRNLSMTSGNAPIQTR